MPEDNKPKKKEWTYKNFEALLALPERLAHFLRLWFHISKADWDFMVAKVRQGSPYLEWSRSKGKGKGRRFFAAPCPELMKVQRAVLYRFLSSVPVHFARHGGQLGSSIFTNAEHHAGFAKTVFAVDIVNAFPSVYRSRVRACLWKPFEFGFRQFAGVEFTPEERKQMLETLVDLLVWKDRLPQGPPTSPRVFDIVCGKMDQELFELVQTNSSPLQSYRLSIYADNITMSSDGAIPEEVQQEAVKVIRDNGFYTHSRPDKMAYFSPETGTVPVVTGLVILPDGRVLMHPNKVNQLRGRLTRLLRQESWDRVLRGEVAGVLGFIRQVYPFGSDKKLPSKLRKVVASAEARLGTIPGLASQNDDVPTIPPDGKPLTSPEEKKEEMKKKAPKAKAKKPKPSKGSSGTKEIILSLPQGVTEEVPKAACV